MNKGSCILLEMANAMTKEDGVKAVWLDADHRQVSFAFTSETNSDLTKQRLHRVVSKHQPEQVPDCAEHAWDVVCELCDRGTSEPMPQGIRLLKTPEGVLLEKETEEADKKHWQWKNFQWVKLTPRRLPQLSLPLNVHELEAWKKTLAMAILCGIFTCTGLLLEKTLPSTQSLPILLSYLLAYVSGGWFLSIEVWEMLKKRILDVHFLMLCVAVGAAFVDHWWEGAILLFLFSVSDSLEDLALSRTEREIKSLFKEAPKYAQVVEDSGQEARVAVHQLKPGAIIRVRPGQQFPVDAEICSGNTAVDEANLTGESIPVDKEPGDTVFSGTLNIWGSVECRVLRPVRDSALSKIIHLIREAQVTKAPSQRFTDKFGTKYTYTILGASFLMFFVWWLGMGVEPFVSGAGHTSAFYRSMTLLVVASPCALVLSIPSAILAGIATGAKRGVLFRGGAAIEKLADIDRVALDKTGTLTTGELKVLQIESFPAGNEAGVLKSAAALCRHSTHPVSRAVLKEYRESLSALPPIRDVRSLTGLGMEAVIDEPSSSSPALLKLGRRTLFEADWSQNLPVPQPGITETLIEGPDVRGRILLRDEIRETSASFLSRLRKQGLKVSMLTGDRKEAAHAIAEKLGNIDVQAELRPEDKVSAIQKWSRLGENVAMVGDGINDAPSLAAAHVSVGMGLRGSDAVLEQADIVLMQDKLENFNTAYQISQKAKFIIRQNLVISLSVIVLLVISAMGSLLPLTMGVVGHEGSTVIVVLNSLRLLFALPSSKQKTPVTKAA